MIVEHRYYTVRCDGTGCFHQPNAELDGQYAAEHWVSGAEGVVDRFGERLPHVNDIFHRVGQKLYCPRCTDVLIEQTKRSQPDAKHA